MNVVSFPRYLCGHAFLGSQYSRVLLDSSYVCLYLIADSLLCPCVYVCLVCVCSLFFADMIDPTGQAKHLSLRPFIGRQRRTAVGKLNGEEGLVPSHCSDPPGIMYTQ